MARNAPNAARKETFGLGKCNVNYDKLFKSFLITEALDRENNYTPEQIQCLESELLIDIQSQENLQEGAKAPQTGFPIILIDSDTAFGPRGG